MRKLKIAEGGRRTAASWVNSMVEWEDLTARLFNTRRTPETMEAYLKATKSRQADIKDIGGFVGGHLAGGHRKRDCVLSRSMLVLDMDFGKPGVVEDVIQKLPYCCAYYSTHKHTPEVPRLRIVIPLSRDVSAEEYGAIGRQAAEEIGIDLFDDSTYEPHRLMYWPSTSKDGDFVFGEVSGELLDADSYLARYDDWHDVTTWPVSSRKLTAEKRSVKEQKDPLSKSGIVGAYCRAHTIEDILENELSGLYAPSASNPYRYDYLPGESTAGVVIYDSKFFYSHHATDPAGGKLLNAFDLVRIHKFQDYDSKKSFSQMADYAAADPKTKVELVAEKQQEAAKEFEHWEEKLECDKAGRILNTLSNLQLILENDEGFKHARHNLLSDNIDVCGPMPWKHDGAFWRDADDAQSLCYIDRKYGHFTKSNFETALCKVVDDRSFHPIRDYFASLPAWDGVPRVDGLLVDYLGAEDNAYVRSVTRKTLCAAVRRVEQPGIKFDNILVLNGPQGIGKSTLIAKLGREWYSDSLSISDMSDKTAAEKLQGYWLMEIGELAGIRKGDMDKTKAFISRQDDKFRASYGRRVSPHPRQCVLFGTTNSEHGYLRDITGNRRFWTVKVAGGTDRHPWDFTDEFVGQVWAETMALVAAGEKLYLEADAERMAKAEQVEALEQDDREGLVAAYLDKLLPEGWEDMDIYQRREFVIGGNNPTLPVGVKLRNTVCNMEIWCECFGKRKEDMRPRDSYDIATIMKRIGGWARSDHKIPTKHYGRQRGYMRSV